MSVQNFTKSLRDKQINLEDRIKSAKSVLDGTTPLNLPQKPVVILEWVFSALTTEPNARKSSEMWKFLAEVWSKSDADSQSKIVRSYKFPQILLDTWKQSFDLEVIDSTLKLILSTTLLGCNSDSQAGQIILGYCTHAKGHNDNILPIFEKQMTSRSKIFKGINNVLPAITGIPHNKPFLVDYFSSRDVDIKCPPEYLDEVMAAIITANVQVTERFTKLCGLYPQHVQLLLKSLSETATKLTNERETMGSLVAKQLELKNTQALTLLLDRAPVETVAHIDDLFKLLETNFDHHLATNLLQKASQTRKLNQFAVNWSHSANPQWFESQFLRQMSESLEQLSQGQLLELLGSLHKTGYLHILANLSYKSAASTSFKGKLLALFAQKDPQLCFSILSLWPSLATDHPEIIRDIEEFDTPECALLLLERGTVIEYPTTLPSQPDLFIARFYKTVKNPAQYIALLDERGTSKLLKLHDIWEYPQVSSGLVNHYIENQFNTFEFMAPAKALNKKQKEKLLELGWTQLNLDLVAQILESGPKSTACETDPKMLVELAPKIDTQRAQLLLHIAAKLCGGSATYAKSLAELIKPRECEWWSICLAAVCQETPDQLVSVLEKNLTENKDVGASIVCLEFLQNERGASINPVVLGQLNEPSEGLFRLLCSSTNDWQAITAYFIYTGCEYTEAFLEFASDLDPAQLVLLIRECIHGKYYKAIQILFTSGELIKEDVIPFITFMVQTVFTYPESLTETQINEYFKLAAHLVRENSWVISQYALETLIMTVPKVCGRQFTVEIKDTVSLYTNLCFFIGQTLLFQRHRLANRNHLMIAALSGLLKCVSGSKLSSEQRLKLGNMPSFAVQSSDLCHSTSAADSLLRVVTNFCDPPQRSVRENSGKNNLTSSVARIRRYVAKTAGILVSNYATLSLQYGFSSEVSSILQQLIFTLLGVLSAQELKSTIASMDNASRAYMKTVHDNYLALGKWKKD